MAIKSGQLIEYKGSLIPAEQLTHGSNKKIICVCDNCGKENSKMVWQYYEVLSHNNGQYYCKDCMNHDAKLIQSKNIKAHNTCMQKYHTDNVMQVNDFKDKFKQTCLDEYGVENPLMLYGNSAGHTNEAREKAVETMRRLYGGCGYELEENRIKGLESLACSGKVRTSSQQIAVYDLVQQIYPNAIQCSLNGPLSTLSLDVLLQLENICIDIEVDGKYWHQNAQKDRARDEIVKGYGYKVLRIKFDHIVPSKEELKEALDILIHSDHKYYELILSDYD